MNTKNINNPIIKDIRNYYKNSSSRIIIFDYDGTLIPFTKIPEDAIINFQALNLVNEFIEDIKNKVVIISGRDRHFLDIQFWNMKLTLIAEHGYLMKDSPGIWKKSYYVDLNWKENVYSLFAKYARLVEGSIIEEKDSTVVWHYRNVKHKEIDRIIKELRNELDNLLVNYPDVQLLQGNKIIEIKSKLYNKGAAITRLFDMKKFDFIMAIGDDVTDEDLFKVMPDFAFTIKIGPGTSFAKFCLNDQSQVLKLLNSIIK